MKLSIMNLFSNHRLVTEVTKTSKYTSRSKLLTSTKEMQISKTGESLNGLSHELPNGTRFFCLIFFQHSERTSSPVLHLFEIRSFIAHE